MTRRRKPAPARPAPVHYAAIGTDGGSTAVCNGVAEGSLCDEGLPGPPTCKKCSRRYR